MQPWELVKLSENLQRLELRRDLGMGSMDRMPSFEQLAGLTRLNSLKVHWPRSHLNFPLFQVLSCRHLNCYVSWSCAVLQSVLSGAEDQTIWCTIHIAITREGPLPEWVQSCNKDIY